MVCMGVTDRRFRSETCSLLELDLLSRPQMLSAPSGLSFNQLHVNKQAAVGFNFAVPSPQAGNLRVFFLIFLLQLTQQMLFHLVKL